MTDKAKDLATAAWQIWNNPHESVVMWFLNDHMTVTFQEVPNSRPIMLLPWWTEEDLAFEIQRRVFSPSVEDLSWWHDFCIFWYQFGHKVSGVPVSTEAPTKGRAAVRAKGYRL